MFMTGVLCTVCGAQVYCFKIISIPDEELFSVTYYRCTASNFVKSCDVPVCFVANPHPPFEAVFCFICNRRRVAVARYQMICPVLLLFGNVST